MGLLAFLAVSFVVLMTAYLVIGPMLARMFHLSPDFRTPAHQLRDGLDYEPARTSALLPQHFSAIAAAGPVVGPILAGLYFGWGPAWIWIILGSIFIGGIHDFMALMASVRHGGKSVAEIVRLYMNPRAYLLFLIFIWFALVYVIVAFADVTAGAFVSKASAASGAASGASVATSSIIYLLLAVAMGFVLRFTRLGPFKAKLIFLPLVFAAIILGPKLPLDITGMTGQANAQKVWGFILLGYCFIAAMAPVWSLLQPRGELGGYFLYIVMIVAVGGILVGTATNSVHIEQDFFKGLYSPAAMGPVQPLFPILFITVACGACSGFHSIVASGTTSKQLDREPDARPIAYGAMLLEGFLACLSLATFMVLSKTSTAKSPDLIYAQGISSFGASLLGPILPKAMAYKDYLFQFALLCFATFVFDTLDACTRLARYVFMELARWKSRSAAFLATAISLIIPAIAMALPPVMLAGKPLPLWKVFWNIFGSSNQLLAALTLLGVTVWLARKKMAYWVALGPTIFMMIMTLWSLVIQVKPYIALLKADQSIELIRHFQFGILVSLIILTLWLIAEAFITWRSIAAEPPGFDASQPEAAIA